MVTPLELRLATNVPLVEPRRVFDDDLPRRRVKNPSVVVRLDGRFGVAHTGRGGFAHLPETFATRDAAERRAWALAREIGATGDWP